MEHGPRATRVERDFLGKVAIPAEAYWGIHTSRALDNFAISGTPIGAFAELVRALGIIKGAAAEVNLELGVLDKSVAEPIIEACSEVAAGRLNGEFVVDVIQGGAGTSTNMNANEVIANRALELMGMPRGHYSLIHPNEHVNLGQSTNDIYPTAIKLAVYWMLERLVAEMVLLQGSLKRKGEEFRAVMKLGRTQLQDAVPMTLGQEFAAFAMMISKDMAALRHAAVDLLEINLGGTAIGTGVNTHPEFGSCVRSRLQANTGLPVVTAPDLIESTQDCGAFISVSGTLKRCAVRVSKLCNDLRLMSSGPRGGLGEIHLPPRQAGSSIMPGKVNPVIPEAMNQVAFQVMGNDLTVSVASEGGQLQLNAFEPVIAHSLFMSVRHLTAGYRILREFCIDGITADVDRATNHLTRSLAHATTISPVIGYAAASEVARDALRTGRTIRDVVLERGLMTGADLDRAVHGRSTHFPVIG